jgi:putative tryptophan/tyrosine transport system substrate-binding protein
MNRREFITLFGGAAAAWPRTARAQKSPIRIGFLVSGAAGSLVSANTIDAVKQGLSDNGLLEGRDYVLEARFAAGRYERFPVFARELAQAGAGVILANTIASVRAAQNVTPPVPIIMLSINDPVGSGLVASLARPGGYTTGLGSLNEDLTPKMLELQRAVLPKATTIAALFNSSNPSNPAFLDNLRTAAGAVGIKVLPVELKSPDTLDAVFLTIAKRHPDALQVLPDSGTLDLSDRIAALALGQRLPSFATTPLYAEFGGLMAYGASRRQLLIRSGYYVKRILDGAKPGDLPVEQPTQIELVVNLKTARPLGIEVPAMLLGRADEVIEQ